MNEQKNHRLNYNRKHLSREEIQQRNASIYFDVISGKTPQAVGRKWHLKKSTVKNIVSNHRSSLKKQLKETAWDISFVISRMERLKRNGWFFL